MSAKTGTPRSIRRRNQPGNPLPEDPNILRIMLEGLHGGMTEVEDALQESVRAAKVGNAKAFAQLTRATRFLQRNVDFNGQTDRGPRNRETGGTPGIPAVATPGFLLAMRCINERTLKAHLWAVTRGIKDWHPRRRKRPERVLVAFGWDEFTAKWREAVKARAKDPNRLRENNVIERVQKEFGQLIALFQELQRRIQAQLLAPTQPASREDQAGRETGTVQESTDTPDVCAAAGRPIFKKVGDTWTISFGGKTTEGVADKKALRDLYYLISHQNQQVEISALPDNQGLLQATSDVARATREDGRKILEQICTLQAEQESEDNVLVHQDNEKAIAALREQYSREFDHRGNPRVLTGDITKMVEATRKRYNRLIEKIKSMNDDLARHLKNNVCIGHQCSYRPEAPMKWDLGAC